MLNFAIGVTVIRVSFVCLVDALPAMGADELSVIRVRAMQKEIVDVLMRWVLGEGNEDKQAV